MTRISTFRRRDPRDAHRICAREPGVPVVIGSDAHGPRDRDDGHDGGEQARRAGLKPAHVLSTRPLDDLPSRVGTRR
jgi:histidinol phosphatase-like PHP family hydrolase